MPHVEDSKAEQFAWRADAEFFVDDSIIRSVKTGVRLTKREADNINTGYDWQGIFASWMTTDWEGGLNINDLGMPYVNDSSMMSLNRSEEHTSELQSRGHLVCRLLLEKKKKH